MEILQVIRRDKKCWISYRDGDGLMQAVTDDDMITRGLLGALKLKIKAKVKVKVKSRKI